MPAGAVDRATAFSEQTVAAGPGPNLWKLAVKYTSAITYAFSSGLLLLTARDAGWSWTQLSAAAIVLMIYFIQGFPIPVSKRDDILHERSKQEHVQGGAGGVRPSGCSVSSLTDVNMECLKGSLRDRLDSTDYASHDRADVGTMVECGASLPTQRGLRARKLRSCSDHIPGQGGLRAGKSRSLSSEHLFGTSPEAQRDLWNSRGTLLQKTLNHHHQSPLRPSELGVVTHRSHSYTNHHSPLQSDDELDIVYRRSHSFTNLQTLYKELYANQ